MEEVFGVTGQNLAVEDAQRLDAIHRRIGLVTDDAPFEVEGKFDE